MTTPAPDRTVPVTCKSCPATAEPIVEVTWHSNDPSHTIQTRQVGGYAAIGRGRQDSYIFICENKGHVPSQDVTLSKAELIAQAEAAWTKREPISV